MRRITGGCHCGNIKYEFHYPGTVAQIPVRACGCGFCTKHGGIYTSHPEGRLDARISNGAGVNKYAFGTHTAEFYICTSCGAVPFVTSIIDDKCYAVVNVNTFENVDRSELDSSVADFDGEDLDVRLARRSQFWIANVTVRGG